MCLIVLKYLWLIFTIKLSVLGTEQSIDTASSWGFVELPLFVYSLKISLFICNSAKIKNINLEAKSHSHSETLVLEPSWHHVRLDSEIAVSLSPWLIIIVTGDIYSLMFVRNVPFFG